MLYIFGEKFKVSENWLLAFPRGPGGFREPREAGRNHFHLSWYLLVPGVTSYDQKTNKENKHIKTYIYIGYVFLKKLGLDSILASWDLKIRIPR